MHSGMMLMRLSGALSPADYSRNVSVMTIIIHETFMSSSLVICFLMDLLMDFLIHVSSLVQLLPFFFCLRYICFSIEILN